MWCDLQRDRPELLSLLEGILIHAVSHLQDSIRERDSLEQALCRSSACGTWYTTLIMSYSEGSIRVLIHFFCFRRESEHDQVVRSIYEEMESQMREEREKHLAQVHTSVI